MTKVFLNIVAVILLAALIATPIYFAKNFAKVAGVKSKSRYLVISQVDKFPNLTISQSGGIYSVNFEKYSHKQAFIGFLLINNPTPESQTYSLDIMAGEAQVFFGDQIDNLTTKVTIPSNSSIPISLYSESTNQTSQFRFN